MLDEHIVNGHSITAVNMPKSTHGLSMDMAVNAQPWLYYGLFFKVLHYFEDKKYSREPTSKSNATRGYIQRKIDKIFVEERLSTTFACKLNAKIRERINVEQDKDWDRQTINRLTETQMSCIKALISKVSTKIKSKTFRPKTYSDPKGCRRFTMLPVLSLQHRNIHIDYQTLCYLAKVPVGIFESIFHGLLNR
jgi:hypothetical protein